jgi:O-antigen ligase
MTSSNSVYIKILNLLSFSVLLLLPLAYIFSPTLINTIILIIVINLLVSSFVCNDYSLLSNSFFKIILVFWIYISVQSFFLENANSQKSISYLRFLLLPFAIAYLLNKNLSKINLLKFFYLLVVLLVAIDVTVQFNTGKDFLGYRADLINGFLGFPFEQWKEHNVQRFSGPFGMHKRAGTFILVFGILGYFLNNKLNEKNNYLYLLFFFPIFVGSIAITGDRSPLIILFLVFIFLIFLERKYRKKLFFVFFISLFTFSLIFIFSKNVKYRFFDNVLEYSKNKDSNQGIDSKIKNIIIDNPWTAHYLTALEIFKDSPIIGKGIRSFRYECIKYPDIKSSYAYLRCSTHPHNTLLEMLAEIGIVGTILFFLIFYQMLRINKVSYSNNLILYLMIALVLPIKPTGAIFSSWFGSIFWLLMGFYYWEITRKVKKDIK